MLSEKEVLEQSKNAFRQWGDTWDSHARINGEIYRRNGRTIKDLLHCGAGRKLLCIANAPSFEDNIRLIKEHETDAVDIACVDKCMGSLLQFGIKPQFVFVSDAGISYDKYCKHYIDETEDIILIASVTANPEWTQNWKGKIYFYVNKDNIKTEERYKELSGVQEMTPASSNVGNAVVVFSTQNFNYDEYLLVGYDYCWGDEDNYYAFEDSKKRFWMGHLWTIDIIGRLVATSQNLLFSARWMTDFFNNLASVKGIKIFNCSGKGILGIPRANLVKKLQSAKIRELTEKEKQKILQSKIETIHIHSGMADRVQRLQEALKIPTITEMFINYIPGDAVQWQN
jgi:hypothetical protein